jgi:hypothetical protein
MTDQLGLGLDGLSQDARDRLDRFAKGFDRVGAHDYALFATKPGDEETEQVMGVASALLGDDRRSAIRAAMGAFANAVAVAYSRRMNLADTVFLYQALPDRPDDRLRVLASLERALVGLVLWDELDPSQLDMLLGPWAKLARG